MALTATVMTKIQYIPHNRQKQLKDHKVKHQYLPINSPDLNPIEYLWWRLDARIQKHRSQIFQEYKERITEEWNKISMKEVNNATDYVSHLLPQIKKAESAIAVLFYERNQSFFQSVTIVF